jgi:hypothetical protein
VEFREHLGVLSEIKLYINTDGSVVVKLFGQNADVIADIINESGEQTEYGFRIKSIIQRFEEHYHVVNNAVQDVIDGYDHTRLIKQMKLNS